MKWLRAWRFNRYGFRTMRGRRLTVAARERYGVARVPGPSWWPWWPLSEHDGALRSRCAESWKSGAHPLPSVVEAARKLTPAEVLAISIDAGIHNPDGTLTEKYGGERTELPADGTHVRTGCAHHYRRIGQLCEMCGKIKR